MRSFSVGLLLLTFCIVVDSILYNPGDPLPLHTVGGFTAFGFFGDANCTSGCIGGVADLVDFANGPNDCGANEPSGRDFLKMTKGNFTSENFVEFHVGCQFVGMQARVSLSCANNCSETENATVIVTDAGGNPVSDAIPLTGFKVPVNVRFPAGDFRIYATFPTPPPPGCNTVYIWRPMMQKARTNITVTRDPDTFEYTIVSNDECGEIVEHEVTATPPLTSSNLRLVLPDTVNLTETPNTTAQYVFTVYGLDASGNSIRPRKSCAPGCVRCTLPTSPDLAHGCTQCDAEFGYFDGNGVDAGGVCARTCQPGYHPYGPLPVNDTDCYPCAPVDNADVNATITCTSPFDSVPSACLPGRYRDMAAHVAGASAASCPACAPVDNADVNATITCTSPFDSVPSACLPGHHFVASAAADTPNYCAACAPVANASTNATVTCTTFADSIPSACLTGHYLDMASHAVGVSAASCPACPLPPLATAASCSTSSDSIPTACDASATLVGGICVPRPAPPPPPLTTVTPDDEREEERRKYQPSLAEAATRAAALTSYSLWIVVLLGLALYTVYEHYRPRKHKQIVPLSAKLKDEHVILGIVYARPGDPFNRALRVVYLVGVVIQSFAICALIVGLYNTSGVDEAIYQAEYAFGNEFVFTALMSVTLGLTFSTFTGRLAFRAAVLKGASHAVLAFLAWFIFQILVIRLTFEFTSVSVKETYAAVALSVLQYILIGQPAVVIFGYYAWKKRSLHWGGEDVSKNDDAAVVAKKEEGLLSSSDAFVSSAEESEDGFNGLSVSIDFTSTQE